MKILDCTLRDGGYYNNWDFSKELIEDYLAAMSNLKVDFVEIGSRSLKNDTYKGTCAYTAEPYLNTLDIPTFLQDKIGVMINGAELISKDTELKEHQNNVLSSLFTNASKSLVTLVRIACHLHEVEECLSASVWLKEKGYKVGFNIMSIAQAGEDEIIRFGELASQYDIDVLYFADSMGSLDSNDISQIVKSFKQKYSGELGIHTHDNMGQALSNSMRAIDEGVTWIDSTVTGMGRGPGNMQTEYLVLALEEYSDKKRNITKLLEIISKYFKPLKDEYQWGTNSYYFLAGKYSIHPSYIQTMLVDNRYSEEDILSVIEHLKTEGGKKFSIDTLESSKEFYKGDPKGTWKPIDDINSNIVLIIGTGPSTLLHIDAIESYIVKHKPYVIALNTKKTIKESLINTRTACHPMRLLADCNEHLKLNQPLIAPISMLPEDVKESLKNKKTLDFGLSVQKDTFLFEESFATLPTSLVIAYTLAIATSGNANKILLAGFDGYAADDPRNVEMDNILKLYLSKSKVSELLSITPTRYRIPTKSIYGFINGE